MLKGSGAQTVGRALAVLGLFTPRDRELSMGEIASGVGLHVSTARRLVAALEADGFVRRTQGGYALGFRLVELAGLALNQSELVRHSLAELDRLRDELALNANLAILERGDALHLAYAVRADTPRHYTTIGRRAAAHCTALGKVLLSARPREAVREVIERRGWRPYTERSIQDFDTLDRVLDEVAARGWATDVEERKAGIACIAAPVRDATGAVVAAISVSGPVSRFGKAGEERIRGEVMAHAGNVSEKLGFIDA